MKTKRVRLAIATNHQGGYVCVGWAGARSQDLLLELGKQFFLEQGKPTLIDLREIDILIPDRVEPKTVEGKVTG